jgi:hypothetical protein
VRVLGRCGMREKDENREMKEEGKKCGFEDVIRAMR